MIVYSQAKINALFKASDLLNTIRDENEIYFSIPFMAFRNAISNLKVLEKYNTIYQRQTEVCEAFDKSLEKIIESITLLLQDHKCISSEITAHFMLIKTYFN